MNIKMESIAFVGIIIIPGLFLLIPWSEPLNAQIPSTNLVSHWKFDETSWEGNDDEVVDSESTNHGSGENDADTSSNAKIGDYCGEFDGTNDHVEIPNDNSLEIDEDLTVAGWFYWEGSTDNTVVDTIICMRGYFWIFIKADDHLRYKTGAEPWTPAVETSEIIPRNRWTHFAVTRDGDGTGTDSVKIYINGILSESGDMTDPGGNGVPDTGKHASTFIGCYGSTSSTLHFFDGKIDDVVVYNSELNLKQVNQIYGQLAYWKLDETSWSGTTGEVDDYCGAHDGTAVGNADTDSDSRVGSYSGEFDGVGDFVEIPEGDEELEITSDFSMSAWIYWEDSGVEADTILCMEGSYWIFITSDDYLRYKTGKSPWDPEVSSNSPITNYKNDWNHVAVTRDGDGTGTNSVKIYMNGQQIGSGNMTHENGDGTPVAGDSPTYIGTWGYYKEDDDPPTYRTKHYFKGKIDDVHIYDRVISEYEVADLYLDYPSNMYFSFEGVSDSEVLDDSLKTNTGTVVNADLNSNGKIEDCMAFNGDSDIYGRNPDHIRVSDSSDIESQAFTLSCWFKVDNHAGILIFKSYEKSTNSYSASYGLEVIYDNGYKVRGFIYTDDTVSKYEYVDSTEIYPTTSWCFASVAFNPSTDYLRIYWSDGETNPLSTAYKNWDTSVDIEFDDNDLYIGCDYLQNGDLRDGFDGYIDEVSYYPDYLVKDEIEEIWDYYCDYEI